MKKTLHATSIRRRLLAYLSGGLLALWLATALASAAVALHEINEIADSQMSQLARSLMQVPQAAAGSTADLPPAGGAESSNNGFAIWDKHGTLLLADRYGREFPFRRHKEFTTTETHGRAAPGATFICTMNTAAAPWPCRSA